MSFFNKTLFGSFAFFVFISVGWMCIEYKQWSGAEWIPMVGLIGVELSVTYFFIGIVTCIPKQSRSFGQALLISAGVVFLIGLGFCSQQK
jgi:hypothetical protein